MKAFVLQRDRQVIRDGSHVTNGHIITVVLSEKPPTVPQNSKLFESQNEVTEGTAITLTCDEYGTILRVE